MKITARILKAKGACTGQVDLFKSLFPKGVEVTEDLCIQHVDKFDWYWAASNLLPPNLLAEYERAIASAANEYERAIAPARAKYDRAIASAWAEYIRAISPSLAEYNRARASALAEYIRASAPSLAEYNRASASAFGKLAETL